MIDTDVRALLVTTYDFRESDYAILRRRLAETAWNTVRAGISVGYILEARTFPRWTSATGMMAFTPIQGTIDLTCDACVCYQINESPIVDWISTDASAFAQHELGAKSLQHLLSIILENNELSSLFLWIGECETLPPVQNTTPTQAIELLRTTLEDGFSSDLAFQIILPVR